MGWLVHEIQHVPIHLQAMACKQRCLSYDCGLTNEHFSASDRGLAVIYPNVQQHETRMSHSSMIPNF